jgi:hypothetical protein
MALRENCRPTTAARSSTVRILWAQALDAGSQQGLNGRRHVERRQIHSRSPAVTLLLEGAVVDQHADQLAEEERVALAGGEYAPGHRGRQLSGTDHVGGQPRRRAGVETAEGDDLRHERPDRGERRTCVAQLGARRGQYQQRDVPAPLDQVLDQVEQQRLGPLQVVDGEKNRLRGGERGEEAANDEEGLLG